MRESSARAAVTARRVVRGVPAVAAAAVAALVALACGPAPTPTASAAPDLVLTNVTIVDVQAGVTLGPRSIAIAGDRIVAITETAPATLPETTRVIDAKGQFVMPGLWDAHAHLSYWGEDALDRLVGHGITTIREMGGDPDEIARWREQIAAGERLGPSMFWCGPFFEGPAGGDEYRWTVATPAEATARANELLDRGVDFLKIQPAIGRDEVAALVAVASARGSTVVGHVPEGLSAIEAAELGLRSIEHLPYPDPDDAALDATLAAMLEHGTWASPALFSYVAQVEASGESRTESPGVQRAYALVRRLYEAGVPMLVGANFAYRDWPHRPGSALHGEMEVLVEAGIPAAEVLRMTTIGNARFLGVDAAQVAVVPGARAELLLLGANPLHSIGATRQVAGVVLRGRWIDDDEARRLRDAAGTP